MDEKELAKELRTRAEQEYIAWHDKDICDDFSYGLHVGKSTAYGEVAKMLEGPQEESTDTPIGEVSWEMQQWLKQ